MNIFDVAQTCIRTRNLSDAVLHDCCLEYECCLVHIRNSDLSLSAWTDSIYDLLNCSVPPCPSHPDRATQYVKTYSRVLYPFSLYCYTLFAYAVLPIRQHQQFCTKIKALTSPEKQYLWLIDEIEGCISGLEKEAYDHISQKSYYAPYAREWERIFRLARLADVHHFARILELLVADRTTCQILIGLHGQIAEGLNYLHTLDVPVIHGDLRCANILVDDDERPRIADFGLACIEIAVTNVSGECTGHCKGTARWQAPELLLPSRFHHSESKLTKKTDVYAFAMTCLEVITEEAPFQGLREAAVMIKVAVEDGRPLRPSVPCMHGEVGTRVWSVIEDCWKTFPHERPPMSHVATLLSQLSDMHNCGNSEERGTEPFDLFSIVQELATVHFNEHDFEPLS